MRKVDPALAAIAMLVFVVACRDRGRLVDAGSVRPAVDDVASRRVECSARFSTVTVKLDREDGQGGQYHLVAIFENGGDSQVTVIPPEYWSYTLSDVPIYDLHFFPCNQPGVYGKANGPDDRGPGNLGGVPPGRAVIPPHGVARVPLYRMPHYDIFDRMGFRDICVHLHYEVLGKFGPDGGWCEVESLGVDAFRGSIASPSIHFGLPNGSHSAKSAAP